MKDRSLPTLVEVAADAGVATSTVSRCLSDPERVAPDTRERILASVESLGYLPNHSARALAARRSHTVGAIIPTMTNAIFARGLQAFQDELMQHGVTLLVSSSSFDPDIEDQQIRTMVARGADGLLLIGKHRHDESYRFLESRGIPVVITWTLGKAGPWSYVGFDNAAATTLLAGRAIELGHRHFAWLGGEPRRNDRAADRIRGVKRALKQNDLDPASLLPVETHYSIAEASDAFRAIMQRRPTPSIVMCGTDVQAVGALKMARLLGLSVPDDVSITGFDDIELAEAVAPGLTTIQVPHREMGRQAAQVLLAQVDGSSGPRRIKLPTRLVERESLGMPGNRRAGNVPPESRPDLT